jgi:UDP-N-acetylmuramoylalanine--D-glutamate ligase
MDVKGLKTVVVGMQKSGIAAVEFLSARGADVRATDIKPLAQLPQAAEVLDRLHVPFAQQAPDVLAGADLVVTSPDVPADLPILQGHRVVGEVELAGPYLKGRTIGITGSNGKTTTTSLIGHILRDAGVPVQVGGNIGKAVCSMVESSRDDGWNVLELSSFQLETIAEFRAHIALALNVTQNHLDRHHTFEHYTAAKRRIVETQRAGDFAILNAEDPTTVSFAAATAATPQWFSSRRKVEPGAHLCGDKLVLDGKLLMTAAEIPIPGLHNVENVLAAAIAAARVGVSREQIAAAVHTFRAVEHRLEFVRTVSGVNFYNDSKATSVDATLKALSAFDHGVWLILGGKDKGLDYSLLREPLRAKGRAALLIGAAANKIAGELAGALPLIQAGTIDAAIARAFADASPGDTVLLAPACASFDQFRSFEHRGEVFKEIVNGLSEKS